MEGDARQLVKEGTVTACFPERHTCRVVFADKDDMTSAEMPILTMCAFDNKFYSMPDVGDVVVCLFASNADQTGTGWIIGSRFNDKSKPNANSQDVTRMDFKDGTFIEYDRESHELKVNCQGKVFVDAKKDVSVKTEAKAFVEAKEDITIKSDAKILVEAKAEIVVKSEDSITLKADQDITLDAGNDVVLGAGGEIVFSGAKSYSLTATENVVIRGEQVLIN